MHDKITLSRIKDRLPSGGAMKVLQAYRFALDPAPAQERMLRSHAGAARPGTAIGIDLGVKTLLTGADHAGHIIAVTGPRALRVSLRRLRRASRAHSRKARGSTNRRKAAARLARLHARVASVRADALHKATSQLAGRYETVVAEDLNVAGMTRNRRLARAVADAGFGAAVRMLGYKTTWNGARWCWPAAGTPPARPARA